VSEIHVDRLCPTSPVSEQLRASQDPRQKREKPSRKPDTSDEDQDQDEEAAGDSEDQSDRHDLDRFA
jgi:hypothetical protein